MGVVSLASGPSGFAKTEVGLVDLVRPVGQLCLVALLRLVGHEGPGPGPGGFGGFEGSFKSSATSGLFRLMGLAGLWL